MRRFSVCPLDFWLASFRRLLLEGRLSAMPLYDFGLSKNFEEFAEKFQEKWKNAEEENQRELKQANPSPSNYFSTGEAPCEMETMIQELRQMEAEKRIGESQTADKTEKEK